MSAFPKSTALAARFIDSMKWNATIRIFEQGIRVLSSLVIARGLGVRLYGVNASVNSLLTLFPVVLSLGFEQVVQVFVPRWMASSAEQDRVRTLVNRLVVWRFAIYGSAAALLYVAAPFLARWVQEPGLRLYLHLVAPAIVIGGLSSIYGNVAQARLRIRGFTIFNMVMQVAGLAAAFCILRAGGGIAGLLTWGIIAAGAGLCFYGANAKRMIPQTKESFKVAPVLSFAGIAWLTSMWGQFLAGKEIDIMVMNLFHLPWESIAAYSLGASLGVTLGFLGNGTGPLFQGALAEAAVNRERRHVGAIWQVAIKTSAVLWVPLLFFVFCFAPDIVARLYGSGFRRGARVFQAMALPQLAYSMLGGSFSGPLFFALRRQNLALSFRIAAGVLNLVLDFVLVPRFGIIGAIVGTSLAMVAVGVSEMIMVYRLTRVLPPGLFLAKWLGAFAIAGLSAMLVPDLGWLVWGVRIVVYATVAVVLLRILRPLEAEERELLSRHIPAGRWVFVNL
jgi:O-antigen/teichoic acid export membrane protein